MMEEYIINIKDYCNVKISTLKRQANRAGYKTRKEKNNLIIYKGSLNGK